MAASCKKDPVPGPAPETGKKAQISKTWKVTSMLVNNSPAPGVDLGGYSFAFKTDGAYAITAGTYSGAGTWDLNSTGQQIILDAGTTAERAAVIVSVSDTRLEIEFTEPATGKTGERKVLFKLKQ